MCEFVSYYIIRLDQPTASHIYPPSEIPFPAKVYTRDISVPGVHAPLQHVITNCTRELAAVDDDENDERRSDEATPRWTERVRVLFGAFCISYSSSLIHRHSFMHTNTLTYIRTSSPIPTPIFGSLALEIVVRFFFLFANDSGWCSARPHFVFRAAVGLYVT